MPIHPSWKHPFQAVVIAVIALVLLSIPLPWVAGAQVSSETAPQPIAPASLKVLYNGSLNTGTPDTQGFLYLTYPLTKVQATQAFTSPATILDSTSQMSDSAGYFANPLLYPPLDRFSGYQVLFTVQVVSETHVNPNRAGFSLLVESSDKRGIELGFWGDEIWAQEGGTLQPFTHAEGAVFTTTATVPSASTGVSSP